MAVIHATEENFVNETKSGLALVDFYADWCGPCKMLSPVLDELAPEVEGSAKIVKVNIDDSRAIAAQFKVMRIPTLALVKDGEVVFQEEGFKPKEVLEELINSHSGKV